MMCNVIGSLPAAIRVAIAVAMLAAIPCLSHALATDTGTNANANANDDTDGQAALACTARDRTVHGPALAVPRARLAPAGVEEASVFRAAYVLAQGSGTLTRTPLVRDADGGLRQLAPLWDAGTLLTQMDPGARRIFAFDPASGTTAPFLWQALPAAQQAALDRPPEPADAPRDGLGPSRLAWLRGERTLEGQGLRSRPGLLGDAVHGTPVFAGASIDSPLAVHDEAHRAFQRQTLLRVPAVYLGANDGMLHAFDARSGIELFAYVPAMLAGALNQLPAPAYRHRPYVDGPLAIGEARLDGRWRTVLAGSPGMGARGLFALDITDPADFSGGLGVLWEFGEHDDAAVGNLLAPPQVARLHVRSRNGVPQHRYFVVAGNGVLAGAADGAEPGAAPGAVLFLLALDKPPAQAWRRDSNYYRLLTPAAAAAPASEAGLAAPALVPDDDGVLRHAYAGDLQGNLWRFDFTRAAPWRSSAAQRPVFVARDGQGVRQPIVQQPKVVHAPGGGYLVLFGTGTLRSRAERDPARFTPQSFYAIHDDPAHPATAAPTRADLLERRLNPSTGAGAGFAVDGRHQAVGAGERAPGWYVDFADASRSGERSIASAAIVDGKVVFGTVVPGPDPCADSASRLYILDALSGLPPDSGGQPAAGAVTGALLPDFLDGAPLLLPVARARTPAAVRATHRQVTRTTDVVAPGAAGAMPRVATSPSTLPAGRLSWREVANWRQLHGAAAPPPDRSPARQGRDGR